MIVFISWSGDRSRYVAEQMRIWLKDVIHGIEPWVSSEDIRQGARWSIDVARRLQESSFGILCLTKDNLSEPWILFEAGALAKALDQSHVCPYLIDLKPSELRGPLIQFQAAQATEIDTRKLVKSINKALGQQALQDEQIDRAYSKWWPDLEEALKRTPQPRTAIPETRSDRELLEEVVDRMRRVEIAGASQLLDAAISSIAEFPQSLLDGKDVRVLLRKVDSLGKKDDENVGLWSNAHAEFAGHSLDGLWATRWNGGTAGGGWVTGVGRIQVYGSSLYVLTRDGRADCLIAARILNGNRLAGRYINLGAPREVLPWVGLIVSGDRIDGFWTDGRWDLRRGQP